MNLRPSLLAIVVLVGACKRGEAPAVPAAEVSQAELRRTHALGEFIADFERVGRIAQGLLREGGVPFDGWILDSEGEGATQELHADFYVRTADGPALTRRFKLTSAGVPSDVETFEPPAPMSPTRAAMARARDLALAHAFAGKCEVAHDAVVLDARPYHGRDGWAVYVLPHGDEDAVYTGGHARMFVSRDGTTLEDVTPLSSGCRRPPLPPEQLGLIHIEREAMISDVPLEHHVYLSVRHAIPVSLTIVKGRLMWMIRPDGIARMTGTPKQDADSIRGRRPVLHAV